MKVADHVWSVLCKDFTVDNDAGNITLFKVLEQLTLAKPADVTEDEPDQILFNMAMASLWSRSNRDEPEACVSRYIFKSPSGKTIGSQEYPIDLKKHVRHRNLMRIPGLAFDGFGRYQFVIQKQLPSGKWTRVAMIPLEVIRGETPE